MNQTDTTPPPRPNLHPAVTTTIKVLAVVLAWIATAGVVGALTAVYTTNKTAESTRAQAERDYLRGERRVAYASFEACDRKTADAITEAVTISGGGPHPPRQVPYPPEISATLHAALNCLTDAYIQVQLLAPTTTAKGAGQVLTYYASQIQGFDQLQSALTENPQDAKKINLGRAHFAPADNLDHPDPNRVDISDIGSRLLDSFRSDLGSDS